MRQVYRNGTWTERLVRPVCNSFGVFLRSAVVKGGNHAHIYHKMTWRSTALLWISIKELRSMVADGAGGKGQMEFCDRGV